VETHYDTNLMNDKEWVGHFRTKITEARIPISGLIELTSRCNLRCVHCYLGPQEEQHKKRSMELGTEEVKSIIDQLIDSGCLNMTFTGGDPMMRKDFPEIYRHAKEGGVMVSVFCDGVLVNDKYIKLFKELPPYVVEISVYGATKETYEKVTRIKGSFVRCMQGIDRLLENGINVSLKTVLLEINKHEFEMIREFAEGKGLNFRFDGAIFPCLPTKDKAPLAQRLEPQEVVWKEMSREKDRVKWQNFYESKKNIPHSDDLYQCGAGVTGFYIDPFGNLSGCIMTTQYRYNLKDSSFQQIWNKDIKKMRDLKARAEHECNTCDLRGICTGCAAFNYLETGAEDVKSEYVCSITQKRFAAINSDKPLKENPVWATNANSTNTKIVNFRRNINK